jgi:DNA-binding transcriptional ArsR family regulator
VATFFNGGKGTCDKSATSRRREPSISVYRYAEEKPLWTGRTQYDSLCDELFKEGDLMHEQESSVTACDTTCEIQFVHAATVAEVGAKMPSKDLVFAMAETFKLLGDPTRLRVVHALSYGELCVCDLAAMLGIAQTALSNHLRLLRSMRLVNYRREGKMAYYSLADEHINHLLAECLVHVQELQPAGAAR